MQTAREQVRVGSSDMTVYVAQPDAEQRRGSGVVVVMEAFGVNGHIEDVTRRLAQQGHVAVAPDLYHRQGEGLTGDYEDPGGIMGAFAELSTDGMQADLAAAHELLVANPGVEPGRTGAIGFCLGGYGAYLAATRLGVSAAASFYGAGTAISRGGPLTPIAGEADAITGRILCFYGDQDPHIPPEEVDAVRTALQQAGVSHEVIVYEGADHGFFCDERASYHREAAEDAWRRTTELFEGL